MINALVIGLFILIFSLFLVVVYELLHRIGFIKWRDDFKKKHNTLYQWIVFTLAVSPAFGFFVYIVILIVQ